MENCCIDFFVLSLFVCKVRGICLYGFVVIEFVYVVVGCLDGYIILCLVLWDFVVGKVLIEEVGGVMMDLEGKLLEIFEKSSVFVSKLILYDEIFCMYFEGKWNK